RTFRVAVSGNLFTRLGIGGNPILLPHLYQVGLGFSPIESGLLIMPQAFAAMSLKLSMPLILRKFGYRSVLVANTLLLGLMIMLFATIDLKTPVWVIVLTAFGYGFLTSLQYTSMNTLAYADVDEHEASPASTIASTVQQLAVSFGIATASLAAALFIPDRMRATEAQMIHGVHLALICLAALTITSTIVFVRLRAQDGAAVSRHKAELPTL
ncbi:MAG: drug resistance transporter, EmrB/QacA subfamily, partial [Gammaproteobacteria bacterium]|nr:drug resistance transporter, EmrB/QacA subfamily [Gammaproteobacteria bacterium]